MKPGHTLRQSLLGLALLCGLLSSALAQQERWEERWEERPQLLQAFKEAGVAGTIVVFDTLDKRWLSADSQRAYTRYLPASTFKIPHTLIALESGVVSDEQQTWQWDGKPRSLPDWNQDQTLSSAFQRSTVWVYQDIARSIGAARMQHYLDAFHYGNARISPQLDLFWLTGDLRISPVEQIDFLRRLKEGRLPLSARTLEIARRVMLREETATYRLYAKTGWADAATPGVGWFVGWLERGERTLYFALAMDMPNAGLAPKREQITRQVLRELGAFD